MRVILVDDEPLALRSLRRALLNETNDLTIAAEYSNPYEAMSGILEHRPDAVFLDIQMPKIDGLKLGKQIQAALPGIEIVFVTGYDRYAVKAFELYALDYVLKPVNSQRLRQTLERVKEKLAIKGARQAPTGDVPYVRCLDRIRFQLPDAEEQAPKWRTSKAQELFAYLLHHRNRTVGRSVLLELLWPEVEESKAAQHLYTAIYHIRKTLKACGLEGISIHIGELESGYQMDLGDSQVDAEVWEDEIRRLGALDENSAELYESALDKYSGDYLGSYEYLWAEHERERLRLLWQHQMKKLGEFYEVRGVADKAVGIHRKIQMRCPDAEDSYFSLMKLYDGLADPAGVEEQYWLLKEKVERELELPVSSEITDWYERWKTQEGASLMPNR
ncbi:histidine kinase [Cohnella sp. CIP 111063]|uniref:response regulator n=1 Tax=unclassified Cohnella TaxID=2636738 RepID=UPI000B8BBEC2|nr:MULTISPECIES: response regulator [unclassified Cohnella]OXS57549.1 histidine kinase [Cohnella sp. CIP 111063]PRX70927.1 two-component SAPR family response regulator [Cohnella sp. SGD-V74]